MSTTVLARPSKSVAVTVIGLITLLLGTTYAAFGAYLAIAGAEAAKQFVGGGGDEAAGGFGPILAIIFEMVAILGICLVIAGLPTMAAGLGVLLRQQWGRVLTFVVAGLVLLLGLSTFAISQRDAVVIGLGAVQVLYAVLVFVVLSQNGAEFARSRN
jgi:hypothetical protein